MVGSHRKYGESRFASFVGAWLLVIIVLLALSSIWPLLLWLVLVLAVVLAATVLGAVLVCLALGNRGSHNK